MSIGQIVFWIVVVALIIWLARHWSGARQAGPPQTPLPPAPPLQTPPPVSQWTVTEDAVAVVKRRYAAARSTATSTCRSSAIWALRLWPARAAGDRRPRRRPAVPT